MGTNETTRDYIPKPFYKMTDAMAKEFAVKQAAAAAQTTRFKTSKGTRGMTVAEAEEYARAIFSSIRYFNDRDARHEAEMKYLRECMEHNELHAEADAAQERKPSVFFC